MKNTTKDTTLVIMQIAERILISVLIVGLCVFGILTSNHEGDEVYQTLSGWIVGLPLFALIPFFWPMEYNKSSHVYANKRYNDLLSLKEYALNPAQDYWTGRLLTYLKACTAKKSKVTPDEMDSFIKRCYERALNDSFGADNSVCFEEADPKETEDFAEIIRPFVYAEV